MNHITELRKKAGFKNMDEASKHLKISKSMYTKIECNIRKPSVNLALMMTKVFKCSLDDIFLPYNFTDSEVS